MSKYYLVDRYINAYVLASDDFDRLKAYQIEQKKQGYRWGDSIIIATRLRPCGWRIVLMHFPTINAFFPPHKDKHSPRVEIFGWSILIERQWDDEWDRVIYDPEGEYAPGEKVQDIKNKIRLTEARRKIEEAGE